MTERLLTAFLQSWLALTIGLLACLLLRRTAASVRCWVWRGVLLKPLLVLLIAIPIVVVRGHNANSSQVAPGDGAPWSEARAKGGSALRRGRTGGEGVESTSAKVRFGSGAKSRSGIGASELRKSSATPKNPNQLPSNLPSIPSNLPTLYLAGVLGILLIRFKPRLKTAPSMPHVAGVFRPRIVIPDGLAPSETAMAQAHERAHVERHDPLWSVVADLCCAALWFAPPVWIAAAAMRAEAESACDEAAIRQTKAPIRTYAELLLAFSGPAPANALGGPARRLARRILMLNRTQKSLPRPLLATLALAGFALLLPWQAIAAQTNPGPDAGPLTGPARYRPAFRIRMDDALDVMLFEPGIKEKIGWTPEQTTAYDARSERWNRAFRAWADPHMALQKKMTLKDFYAKDARERPLAFTAADKAAGPRVWTPEQGRQLKSLTLARFGSAIWDSPEMRRRLKLSPDQLSHLVVENQEVTLEYCRVDPGSVLRPIKVMPPLVQAKVVRLTKIYVDAPPSQRDDLNRKITKLKFPYQSYRRADDSFDLEKETRLRIARSWKYRAIADNKLAERLTFDQQATLAKLLNDPNAWAE